MQFSLESWDLSYAPSLAESADDARVARWLRDSFPHPYTLHDAQSFIAYAQGGGRELHRAVVVGGRAVGALSLTKMTDVYGRSAELGYWLAPALWGQGIMTEAVRRIVREGFLQWNIARIYAEPFADNIGSRRVLEKAGFRLEGVLRQSLCKGEALYDSCIYGLTRAEWSVYEDHRGQ